MVGNASSERRQSGEGNKKRKEESCAKIPTFLRVM